MVRVLGTRNRQPVIIIKRWPTAGKEALDRSMADNIGACCAGFILRVLSELETQKRAGVFCPEDWADPQAYYKSMERLGLRPEQIVETV
jgi:hypothetical protein